MVARRTLVGATALAVVLGGGLLLGRSLSDTAAVRASASTSSSGSSAATGPRRLGSADFAAAPIVALPRLPASAATGRIALPWHRLRASRTHLTIVFASRPSCEQINGVVTEQTASSVTINVLASNIVNAPNCDIVPKLKRSVVTLSAPLAARSLRHAALDAAYWPTNPFGER